MTFPFLHGASGSGAPVHYFSIAIQTVTRTLIRGEDRAFYLKESAIFVCEPPHTTPNRYNDEQLYADTRRFPVYAAARGRKTHDIMLDPGELTSSRWASSFYDRLIAKGPGAWQIGMISIRLTFMWGGSPTTHAAASAMSSAVNGTVPA